ncbi:lantibiotic dehydratase [Streptomyces sp. NPDC087658]|uniref:lantibiotic dehydratase n=1 Tax=Streptomyces sp. NPDC087658 TaxID=3365800 RepID=UPI0037FA2CD8
MAEAIEHASPLLAHQIRSVLMAPADVRQIRRVVVSVARYVLRMSGRSTPVGLFAGIGPAQFGSQPSVRFGTRHRAIAAADASWVVAVVAELERSRDLLARLPVMTNTAAFVRGDRFVVPYPPRAGDVTSSGPAAEVSVRNTPAVRLAVATAQTPISFDALVGKVAAEFPTTPAATIAAMLNKLVKQQVLITSLRAHSGLHDAFGHVMAQLDSLGAGSVPDVADFVLQLRQIHMSLRQHNDVDAATDAWSCRSAVTRDMLALAPAVRRPLAVDLSLDCSLVLPRAVVEEVESAVSVLARLSAYPLGTASWNDYFRRFFARYGVSTPVLLRDVADPDVGLGFPAGYLGGEPEPGEVVSARHRRLLTMAQSAALDGRREIVLDEQTIADLGAADRDTVRVPPHLELCFRLHSRSMDALSRGDFELVVVSASRAVGTMSGRFLGLLEPTQRERAIAELARLAATDPDLLATQVSFSPLDPRNAHVARASEILPAVISVAEHRVPDGRTIPLDDLAVMCDKERLYLVSLSRGIRLSPTALHPLDLRAHTPPLVRFIIEVAKAQQAVVTGFDWGPAAHLPYLPRLRYGRTIVSAARWRLEAAELPGRDMPWRTWSEAAGEWRKRRCLPATVFLAEGDQRLKLDLDKPAHLTLLRTHLVRNEAATLTEAPASDAYAWFDGRPHEIVAALMAAEPPARQADRPVGLRRPVERGDRSLPGAPPWLHAKLYGHPERLAHVLARYLPALLAEWPTPPRWWFTRFRDPEWHLRLRIAVSDAAEFGTAAHRLNRWADNVRRQGLLSDVQFASTFPETGRWGRGAAMKSAEDVFVADSSALVVQFATSGRPAAAALAAAGRRPQPWLPRTSSRSRVISPAASRPA